jgi:alkylation response protein AidB-like acyl-CoA dehydrogenase
LCFLWRAIAGKAPIFGSLNDVVGIVNPMTGVRVRGGKVEPSGPSVPLETIPTLSLQLSGTQRIQANLIQNTPRSAHWRPPAGPPEPSTQIYEGTNQIQRVVIAKQLLG